jgi:YidC/Oxa1 family membrane protein insertase
MLAAVQNGAGAARSGDQPPTPPDGFGRMSVVAWPLYLALRFLYAHATGSWGTAIILLTTLFNLVMIWPRMISLQSSAKMARLRPQVEAIRKRYPRAKLSSHEQAELNSEIMSLYKSEGVNAWGGCLPILLQMPLLFGLFSVFRNAVELRGAGWMWLDDLSKPDPLHILPTIIIASMTLTQFITPSPGMDRVQRRTLAVATALIFGLGLWRNAAGLGLYWATGNLVNLAVQLVINKTDFGVEMNAIARAG